MGSLLNENREKNFVGPYGRSATDDDHWLDDNDDALNLKYTIDNQQKPKATNIIDNTLIKDEKIIEHHINEAINLNK